MKIFVTGGTGFIGRAFCQEAARRGHQLMALARDPQAQIVPGIEIAAGSLVEPPWDKVARFAPDAVLHLAWTAKPGVYLNSPENTVWLEQSKAWFQRLFELGVPYVAGTGTCIEYASSASALNEERSPLEPLFPYSKAKVALCEWLRQHAPANWAWFRVFFPYGAGEHANRYTSVMARQLREGKVISINNPHSVRDYLEVRDAASALVTALEHRLTGPVNIGSGRGVTIAAIAHQVARMLKADEALVRHNPTAAVDPSPVIVADIARLEAVGWQPVVAIADGLQRLVDSLPARN